MGHRITIGIVAVALAAAWPAAVPNAAQAECADVLFLGARGSGQPGPGSRTRWVPTAKDPQGLGGTVQASLALFRGALGGARTIAVAAVDYPAEPVTATVWTTPGDKYWTGLARGVDDGYSQVQRGATNCPQQRYVLSGYSQGAMVMHRLVKRLEARDPQLLARIDAALLIGDGDRVPHDRTRKFGSMHRARTGIGLSPLVVGSSNTSAAKFAKRTGRAVLEVCNRNDSVCDFPGGGADPHTRYAASAALRKAASRAAGLVLAGRN